MGMILALAVQMVTVHQLDGRAINLNPAQITVVVEPRAANDPGKHVHPDANCVIFLTDQHYYSVKESCREVKVLIEGGKP